MDNDTYDLIFSGELVAGNELAQVKKNLQVLFRISDAQVEALFSGKAIPLKKGLNAEIANKYRVAMKKSGAKVNVVLSQAAKPQADDVKAQAASRAQLGTSQPDKPHPDKPQPGNHQPGSQASAGHAPSAPPEVNKVVESPPAAPAPAPNVENTSAHYETQLGAQPQKPDAPKQEIQAPNFDVAAVGDNLLKDSERSVSPPVNVDTSHMSVSAQEGPLVSADEIKKEAPLAIDVPVLDVEPAGSDLLKPQERTKTAPVEVDISALSVDETGGDLAPKKAPAPPAPNVDHIKLAD